MYCISVLASISIGYISRSGTATGLRGFNTLAFNNNAKNVLSYAPRNGKTKCLLPHFFSNFGILPVFFFFFFIFANQMAFSSKGTEWGHNLNFFSISLLAICIFCELPSHVFFLFSFTCHSFINLKLFFFWPSVDLHIAKSNKVFKFLSLSDQPRMITYLFCFIT